MSNKQNSSPEGSSSSSDPELNRWKFLPQEQSLPVSGSELDFSKFKSKTENPICIGSQLSSRRDANTGSEYSSNEINADVHSVSEYSAAGKSGDIHSVSGDLSDKHLKDIVYQLWAISGENHPGEKDSDIKDHLSLNDISLEYWQLYSETRPENFDFAMNIMAYIELLNDNSWKSTVSYFDENIKKMVKYIWNEKKDGVNNMIDLQNFHRGLILKLMVDFTKWSQNRKYEFGEFLNYCVLMCQVGVISRKHGFKTAPLYVINQLRARIKSLNFEDIVQTLFNFVVKEYARKLVEYSRV